MKIWLAFVIGAGLCWGTYVPLIQNGQLALRPADKGPPMAFAAFLCVGIAYFLIAVLFPGGVLMGGGEQPSWNARGTTLALLAGAAGAFGALCVVFAIKSGGDKRYIAPVIFALAPVINTLVSLFWHPSRERVLNFSAPADPPHWYFYVGILLAGLGAGLVLYSKEAAEAAHARARSNPPAIAAAVEKTHGQ